MAKLQGEGYYFSGLPIPDFAEGMALGYAMNDSDAGISIGSIFEQLLVLRPDLQRVIEFDLRQSMHDYDLTESERQEFEAGVWEGYELMVGAVTYVHFLRSGHVDFRAYLNEAPQRTDEILVFGKLENLRLRQVRAGNAIVDTLNRKHIESSRDIADSDAADYLFDAVRLEQLIIGEMDRIRDSFVEAGKEPFIHDGQPSASPLAEARVVGLKHGFAQAVEMYLQVFEQQLIARAAKVS